MTFTDHIQMTFFISQTFFLATPAEFNEGNDPDKTPCGLRDGLYTLESSLISDDGGQHGGQSDGFIAKE